MAFSIFGYSIYIEPAYIDYSSKNINDTFSINIYFDAGSAGAFGCVTLLTWDTTAIAYQSHINKITDWTLSAPVNNVNPEYPDCDTANGIFFWDYSGFTAFNDTKLVYTIIFKIVSKKSTSLNLISGEVIYGGYSGSGLFSDATPPGQFLSNVQCISGYVLLETDQAPPVVSSFQLNNFYLINNGITNTILISDSSISTGLSVKLYIGRDSTQITNPVSIMISETTPTTITYTYTIPSDSLTQIGTYWLKLIAADVKSNTTIITKQFDVINWPINIISPISKSFDTNVTSIIFSGTSEADSILIENKTAGAAPATKIDTPLTKNFSTNIYLVALKTNTIVFKAYKYSLSTPVYTDTYFIYSDPYGPTINSFLINNGSQYTNTRIVNISISAIDSGVGVQTMKISENKNDTTGWKSYKTTDTFTLSAGDGEKTLYLECMDSLGNKSSQHLTTIYLDSVAPVASITIGSSDYTNQLINVLTMTYNDSTPRQKIYIENSSNVENDYKGETTVYPLNIKLTSGDGIKTITARIYDSAGNYTTSSDTIFLDQTGPLISNLSYTYLNPDNADSIFIKIYAVDTGIGINTNNFYVSLTFSKDNGFNTTNVKLNYANSYLTKNINVSSLQNDQYCTVNITGADLLNNTVNYSYVIRIVRATNLSITQLTSFADTGTRTIKSRTVVFRINFGNSSDINSLYRYNSEKNYVEENVAINQTSTTIITDTIIFNSDGQKIIKYKATTNGGVPPANEITLEPINIDITPPELVLIEPSFDGKALKSDTIIYSINQKSAKENVDVIIKINNDTKYSATKYETGIYSVKLNLQTSSDSYKLEIRVNDFIGNETGIIRYFYYLPATDTKIALRNIYDTAPIDSSVEKIIFSLKPSDVSFGFLYESYITPIMNMSNGGTMSIKLNIIDTGANIDLLINTDRNPEILNDVDTAVKNRLSLLSDSGLYYSTIREFEIFKNGQVVDLENDTSLISNVQIFYELPDTMLTQELSVFRLENNEWKDILSYSGNSVIKTDTGLIVSLMHFSFYIVLPPDTVYYYTSLDSVVIFPNPFIPNDGIAKTGVEYDIDPQKGGIHIKGLTYQCKVEIYSILGELIDEFTKNDNSGMYIWNAKNKKGDKVASGIYFVVIKGNNQKVVKKIAIIR